MPNTPPNTYTPGAQYRPETDEDRRAAAAVAVDPRNEGGALHTLVSRRRWEAWRELITTHGNAFAIGGVAVGGGGEWTGAQIHAWDFLSRPIMKQEIANLVAWLLMISQVNAADLEEVCQAQGCRLRDVLELDAAPPAICGQCGGQLAAKCSACGSSFP